MLDHADGVQSAVDCSYAMRIARDPFPETVVEVDGSEGTIRLGRDDRLTMTGAAGTVERDLSPARTHARDNIRTFALVEAAYRSAASGLAVRLDTHGLSRVD